MSVARHWRWIAATLLVAVAVHAASVLYLPQLIMWRTVTAIGRAGGVNRMVHGRRPTAAARGVVRPSPDLLYSTCVYDLDEAGGGLWVRAHGMPHTYWSVSLFDMQTDNFYVVDDRQAKDGTLDLLIEAPDWDKPMPGRIAHAPGPRGLVLVRTLIDDEAHVADIDAARRHVTCEAYQRR
ncbi:MAG: DUF1254 domain-containing protein [Rhizomicrobium sp.]